MHISLDVFVLLISLSLHPQPSPGHGGHGHGGGGGRDRSRRSWNIKWSLGSAFPRSVDSLGSLRLVINAVSARLGSARWCLQVCRFAGSWTRVTTSC